MTTESDNGVILANAKEGRTIEIAPATIDDYYKITMHRDGRTVGTLDFSSGKLDFTGGATESARVFMESLSGFFDQAVKRAVDSRWRKVSEELPEESGDYLCVEANRIVWCGYFQARDGRFFDSVGPLFPTHWMPLPVPPDEEA